MDGNKSEYQKTLSDIFEEGYGIYDEILNTEQPTNSGEVQVKIRRAIKLLEHATILASLSSLFSPNEMIEEVATSKLKYFLLPLLLGNLSQKLSVTDRVEVVNAADVYFRDFLERCQAYGITEIDMPHCLAIEEEHNAVQLPRQSVGQSLENSVRNRASKIKKYNEQKMLQSQLMLMKERIKANNDEEFKRKYYLTLIKYHINEALNELDSLKSEKEILKYMAKIKPGGSLNAKENQEKGVKKTKPLKPIIITRNEVQKKVFGAGYPSLPAMTVKEFYDQRVQDGVFPDEETVKARSLQDLVNQQNAEKMEDREAEEKEQRVERDDRETLAQARAMDDYKDTHQRGWGNRYNRS